MHEMKFVIVNIECRLSARLSVGDLKARLESEAVENKTGEVNWSYHVHRNTIDIAWPDKHLCSSLKLTLARVMDIMLGDQMSWVGFVESRAGSIPLRLH